MNLGILQRDSPLADARIRYGDNAAQFADVRLPITTGPWPGIIVIHGGHWRSSYTLDYMGELCGALSDIGYATWNIEYRRVGIPGGGWPGTFLDVMAASRMFFDQAARLGVDPSRISVLGHSAGGQLASWIASVGLVPAGSPIAGPQLPFAAAIPISAVLDLEQAEVEGIGNGAVSRFLGGDASDSWERYRAASPMALIPSPTPYTIIHGEADTIVPPQQSLDYAGAGRVAGAAIALCLIPRADHIDVIDPTSTHWPTVIAAIATACER